jgi:EpsI family protein
MRLWIAAAAMLAATALAVQAHRPRDLAAGGGVLAACPAVLGEWNGTDLSFEDAVVEALAADDLLIRRYRRGEDLVWLCVVYHRGRRYGAHDPRVCYQSQGWLLDRERRVRVATPGGGSLEVNRFVVARRDDRRVVYYWWATEGLATPDAGAFRARMALRGALRGALERTTWGAFVRVEAQVRGGDDAAADRAAAGFAGHAAAMLPGVLAAGGRPVAGAVR